MKYLIIKIKYICIIILILQCSKPPIKIISENNPLETHRDIVLKVRFSPDDQLLASGGNDSDLILWDGRSGVFRKKLVGEFDKIFNIAFLESKNEIVTGNYGGTLLTWNSQKGIVKKEQLDQNFISDFDFYFPGKFFVVSSWDTSILVFKMEDHTILKKCKSSDYKIRTIKYSDKTKSVYAGTASGNLMRWSLEQCIEGENYNSHIHNDAITSIEVNDEMELLMTSSVDGQIKLFNLHSLQETVMFNAHMAPVNIARFISPLFKVASGDKNGKIFIWDTRTLDYVILSAHTDSVNTLDISHDAKFIASGSSDRTVKIWSIQKILSAPK